MARTRGRPKVAVAMELSQNRRRLIGRLRSRRQREREGAVLVEGVRAVEEVLGAGAQATFAVAAPSFLASTSGAALLPALSAACEIAEVEDADLAALADTEQPQGVLLICRQPQNDLETLPDEGALLVLDAVQDPGNLGTLVRSAVAFGLDGVIALDGCTDPWSAKAVRASTGAMFRIPVWNAKLPAAVKALQTRGADVLVASGEGRPATEAFVPDTPLMALVLGNEGAGVRDEVRRLAREAVAVPMKGEAESLNVGVAGSILMYEWTR